MNELMIHQFKTTHFVTRMAAILTSLFFCQLGWAQSSANQGMVFEGTLTDNSGNPIDLQGQQLFYYVTAFDSSSNKCILYAESSSTSGDSSGLIVHRFGSGSPVVSPISFNNSLSNSVFSDVASGKLADGSGNSCSVAVAATRYAEVYSSVLDVTATIILGSTPYSQFAYNAKTLNGKIDTDFILATSLNGGSNGQVLSRNGTSGFSWVNLPVAASGTSVVDLTQASGTLSVAHLPDFSTNKLTAGTLPTSRGGTGMSTVGFANQLLAVSNSGSGLEYKSIVGSGGVSVTTGSGAVNIALNLDNATVTSALGYQPSNRAGDTFSGDTKFLSNVGIGTVTPMTRLDVSGSIRVGYGSENCNSIMAGTFRYDGANMEYCNGSSWQDLASSGGGVSPIGAAGGDLTGSYPAPSIAANAVTNSKIMDGSILGVDIASSTITYNKLLITDNEIPQVKISGLTSSLIAKENLVSGGTIGQYYRGDKSWRELNTDAVSEGTKLYYSDTRVRAVSLAGFSIGPDVTVVAADTIVQAFQKLQGQINSRWQTASSNLFYNSGKVSIGDSTFPGSKLYVKSSDTSNAVGQFEMFDGASTNNAIPILTIARRLPNGTSPQPGFGSQLTFSADDNANNLIPQAAIVSRWGIVSGGALTGQIEFGTRSVASGITTKLIIDNAGHVAITSGNLAVAGSVRIGDDGNNLNKSCTLSEEGRQRYNSNYKAMEFCDGAYWRGITGVTYCDTGHTLVGKPGSASAFCIDTDVNTLQTYDNASATCVSRSTSSGAKPKVCTIEQLDIACENYNVLTPSLINLNNAVNHWTSNATSTGGSNSSSRNIVVYYNSSNLTTCHLKPTNGTAPFNGRVADVAILTSSNYFRCCYE